MVYTGATHAPTIGVGMSEKIVVTVQSDQTLTIVRDADGTVTGRVAKAGHNRAVFKLSDAQRATVAEFLA